MSLLPTIFLLLLVLGICIAAGIAVIAVVANHQKAKQCPACGQELPAVRQPTNTRQAMWGGWTCTGCQAELDRKGQIIKAAQDEPLSGGITTITAGEQDGAVSMVNQGALSDTRTSEEGVMLDFHPSKQAEADEVVLGSEQHKG